MNGPSVVVVVEDETEMREMLLEFLRASGHVAHGAASGREGVDLVLRLRPHLVILDIAMPDLDGLAVCRLLKADLRTRRVPVMILTSNATTDNRIRAVEYAADHFMAKPVSDLEEFSRWVRALLARGGPAAGGARVVDGVLTLSDEELVAAVGLGKPVALPAKLYAVLALLAADPGAVVTRERLISEVWNNAVRDREVDVAVSRLRSALGPAGNAVASVHGRGYRLDLDVLRRL
ncbi:response regulator transcription factor [bacterium]|nr:MAG: response regulator transcription factor [bacterium]